MYQGILRETKEGLGFFLNISDLVLEPDPCFVSDHDQVNFNPDPELCFEPTRSLEYSKENTYIYIALYLPHLVDVSAHISMLL